jgi:UDP-N-acetylmuramate dehydrogenase
MSALLESIAGVRSDVALAPMTTYKVGGPAAFYLEAESEEQLATALVALPADMELFVLGRGSNVVISDHGFPGLVVTLGPAFLTTEVKPAGDVVAGGAMPLPKLARFAAKHERTGLEFFVGIPGSVGGAVRMNAGGHGSDTKACLAAARIVHRGHDEAEEVAPERLDLSYRHSNLGDGDVVVAATFVTRHRKRAEIETELRAITRWRKERQPGGTLNAGSVFKNPSGDSAGRIIDAVGLKGYRLGPVAVSEMHANFFVADDEATAQDIRNLVVAVRSEVAARSGIDLVPEIRFVGPFDEWSPG